MKRFLSLLITLCLLYSFACAESPAQADPATLTAVGLCEVEERASLAILSIEVTAFGETVTEAQNQMDERLETLRAALQEQGIESSFMRSTHYDVRGQYEYHYTKMTETDLLIGYNVVAQLQSYMSDEQNVGAIIDAVNATGYDCSYDLSYEAIDDPEAYDAALAVAAQDALRKADMLAQACGLTLGRLISIEETEDTDTAIVKVTYTVK